MRDRKEVLESWRRESLCDFQGYLVWKPQDISQGAQSLVGSPQTWFRCFEFWKYCRSSNFPVTMILQVRQFKRLCCEAFEFRKPVSKPILEILVWLPNLFFCRVGRVGQDWSCRIPLNSRFLSNFPRFPGCFSCPIKHYKVVLFTVLWLAVSSLINLTSIRSSFILISHFNEHDRGRYWSWFIKVALNWSGPRKSNV